MNEALGSWTSSRSRTMGATLGLAVVAVVAGRHYDLRLADDIYRWGHHAWRLRHDVVVAGILHRRAQQLNQGLFAGILLAAIVSSFSAGSSHWRRRLWYAVAAMSACYGIVTLGKALLPIPCPWDLARYGGYLPPGGWLQWQSAGRHVKGCFPSGHASGGYAMFAWYFVARDAGWACARGVLAVAGAAGLFLGGVQQLRGAHFASHDVATAALCWAICAGLAARLLPSPPVTTSESQ